MSLLVPLLCALPGIFAHISEICLGKMYFRTTVRYAQMATMQSEASSFFVFFSFGLDGASVAKL